VFHYAKAMAQLNAWLGELLATQPSIKSTPASGFSAAFFVKAHKGIRGFI
jgi:hypothetical protein